MNTKLKKISYSAVFAALVFVATSVIRIPTPGTGGYVHPGDAIVILCGIFLGPIYGGLAAGIGSMLSDLLGGYFVFVPATFLIKGLSAYFIGLICSKYQTHLKTIPSLLIAGLINTFLVVFGYFLFEIFLFGTGAALSSIIPNIMQGAMGLFLASVLAPVLKKVPFLRKI
ncbi:putative membrane protein [Aequitasia blattaphilus]|uniref:ECF transporter S component n=1 Tax=Aequitasia blattaphilus TaxID=2949332 RepID=A0ABT1E5Q7_9FIRM|nr:ECF transporter S component [Aequitasia blattaphilus]MCP1101168.1 ECF transporter S component [Aequitasia blattaphilus]MCR8613808.1 ECF transporter S component [Aequitasia blattaphilus]